MNRIYVVLAAVFITCHRLIGAPGVLTNLEFGFVRDAIEGGGSVVIATDGTVNISSTVDIRNSVAVEAGGHAVIFDAGRSCRHFSVTSGATLRLVGLNLINGMAAGVTGGTNEAGSPGLGGAIDINAGRLELLSCTFSNNWSRGGDAGTPLPNDPFGVPTFGGPGCGGAIYSV
jgi:hypothetical protein